MDDIIFRTRYPRQTIPNRRKTRRSKRGRDDKDRPGLIRRIMIQTVICVFILAAVGIVKSVDSPVTNYFQDKIKDVLAYNVDIKSVFNGINGLVTGTGDSKSMHSEDDSISSGDSDEGVPGDDAYVRYSDNAFDDEAAPVSAMHLSDEEMAEGTEYDDSGSGEGSISVPKDENSFIIPLGGVIGSLYGERLHPIKGTMEFHKGIDIEAMSGTPIKAAAKGEVIEAGESPTFGNYIKLGHEGGRISLYAHCSALLVKKGQSVDKGEVIAKVGSTGTSEGPHLHFEVWEDGEAVNPLDFIQSSSN